MLANANKLSTISPSIIRVTVPLRSIKPDSMAGMARLPSPEIPLSCITAVNPSEGSSSIFVKTETAEPYLPNFALQNSVTEKALSGKISKDPRF